MRSSNTSMLIRALLAGLIMATLIPLSSCGGTNGATRSPELDVSQAAASAEEAQAQLAQTQEPVPPSPQEEAISALQEAGSTASALAADPSRAVTDTEALKASVAASTAELAGTVSQTGDKLAELGLEGKQERFAQESSKVLAAVDSINAATGALSPDNPASYGTLSQVIGETFASPEPAILSADLSHRAEPDTPVPPVYGASIAPAYLAGAPSLTPSSLPIEPGDEDLAETPDAPQTEEITALAEQLGHDPVAIYEWVRNNIDFESYYGSRKGALGCLKEMAGNSTDAASLLIALYRASGIPARYVTGVIELTADQACSWLATDTINDAQSLLASGNIPVSGLVEAGAVSKLQLAQTWVEAYVNYGNYRGAAGGEGPSSWMPLDASYKAYEVHQPEVDILSAMGEDYETLSAEYLSTVRDDTFLSFIEGKVKAWLAANMPQLTLADVMREKTIKQENLGILPSDLLYTPISAEVEERELSASSRWTATLDLAGTTLTCDFVSLSSGALEVSFAPATPEDEALLAAYESIADIPAYLLDMTGEMTAGEQTVQTQSRPFGSPSSWSMTISSPGRSYLIDNTLTWGAPFSVALTPAPGPVNGEITLEMGPNFPACLFDQAASSYISSITQDDSDLARLFGLSLTKGAQETAVGASLAPHMVSNVVVSASPDGLYMDADLSTATPAGKTKADRRDFTLTSGLSSSLWEHRSMQARFLVEAVSTAKLLALANQNGIPIAEITRSNISTIESLALPAFVKQQMRDQVNAGYTIATPTMPISYKDFSGEGWMVLDPQTGEGAYLISGGISGCKTIEGRTSFEEVVFLALKGQLEWMYLKEMTTMVVRDAGGYYPPEEYPDILSNAEYHAGLEEGRAEEYEGQRKEGRFVMGDGILILKVYELKYTSSENIHAIEVWDFLDTSIRPTFTESGLFTYVCNLKRIDSDANPYRVSPNPTLSFWLMPFIKDGKEFGFDYEKLWKDTSGEDILAVTIVDMWDQDVSQWFPADDHKPYRLDPTWRQEAPTDLVLGISDQKIERQKVDNDKAGLKERTFYSVKIENIDAPNNKYTFSAGVFGNPHVTPEKQPLCIGWQYTKGESEQYEDVSEYKYKYFFTYVPGGVYYPDIDADFDGDYEISSKDICDTAWSVRGVPFSVTAPLSTEDDLYNALLTGMPCIGLPAYSYKEGGVFMHELLWEYCSLKSIAPASSDEIFWIRDQVNGTPRMDLNLSLRCQNWGYYFRDVRRDHKQGAREVKSYSNITDVTKEDTKIKGNPGDVLLIDYNTLSGNYEYPEHSCLVVATDYEGYVTEVIESCNQFNVHAVTERDISDFINHILLDHPMMAIAVVGFPVK